MDIEDLVKSMLQSMLPVQGKNILIFLSGGSVNSEILLKTLADFDNKKYDVVISDNGKIMLNDSSILALNGNLLSSFTELEKSLEKANLVLIPILTRNTLAKVALGIEDNLMTTGIARALMMNKEVLAVRDSCNAAHPINRLKELDHNSAYNAMLKNYENQLESFGVKFIELEEFKTVIQNKINTFTHQNPVGVKKPIQVLDSLPKSQKGRLDSSILTLGDLRKYEKNGVIQIKPSTIVTPLARDYITSNHLLMEVTSE